jgi:hypothetical protein
VDALAINLILRGRMESHHAAWLAAHPGRDEAWLQARIADGFSVHHVDGDHGNDAPGNLVLIEHTDHLRLHCIGGRGLSRHPMKDLQRVGIDRAKAAGKYKGRKPSVDRSHARALVEGGLSMTDAARRLGVSRTSVYRAMAAA